MINKAYFETGSYLLILGCERSGSTLLFNILNTLPITDGYFEPFSNFSNHSFNDWQKRFEIKKISCDNLFFRLAKTRICRNGFLPFYPGKRIFLILFKSIRIINRFARSKKLKSFYHLNTNRYINKSYYPKQTINYILIKELRLNLKWNQVHNCLSSHKVIVSLRNPILQVKSIQKTIEKGSLIEFKNELEDTLNVFYKKYKVEPTEIYEKKIYRYLFFNYSELLKDLIDNKSNFLVVLLEELSSNSEDELLAISEFLDVSREGLLNYYQSTKRISGFSPLLTLRNDDYHKKLLNEVSYMDLKNVKEEFLYLKKITGLNNYVDLIFSEYKFD